MIVIRHESGALAGKEQRIEAKSDRITFGRDASACDVVFPPDETIIARRHFSLVRVPSGQWTFDPFGDHYLAVNGAAVDGGAAVRSGDKIELGRPGGPSLEIALEGEGLRGPLPVTETQFKVESVRAAAGRAWRTASRAVRFGLVGAVLAIGAIGGTATFWYSSRGAAARLGELIEEANRRQAQIAADSISQPVRDTLLQAAYFVVAKDSDGNPLGGASASPIGPNVLATNAHVAEMYQDLKPGQSLFVRSPGANGREYKVIGATVHPGFKAFSKFMSEDPFFAAGRYVADFPVYDVGILRVAEGSNLSPVLEIANRQELEDLKPGFHLAMAGYPAEAITSGQLLHIAATPTFAAGMVTAMTDMFMLPADMAHGHLIHHNLPSAGGASGSPMIGPNGKVVAFHNAGTSFRVQGVQGRIPSGVLKGYGQRADLLRDLIEGRAAAVVEADRAYWQQRTAGFKRGIEVTVPSIAREVTAKLYKAGQLPENMAPVLISQDKFRLTDADKGTKKVPEFDKNGGIVTKEVPQRQKKFSVKLPGSKPQLFIAYAESQKPLQMWLLSGKDQLAADSVAHYFAYVSYKAAKDGDAELFVTGPDEDVNGTLFVYGWGARPS